MPSILFVCTANQIRSPFASAAFKKMLFNEGFDMKHWKVDSAGTWTFPNLAIEQRTVSIASELQIDLNTHRSKQIDAKLVDEFDLIIVMEKGQKEAICYEFPSIGHKVFLLSEFDGLVCDFSDPHGMSTEHYRNILIDLHTIINKSFHSIIRKAKNLSNDTIMY